MEFALVAAPLIAITFATLLTALIFFIQSALLTSAEDASRWIITGQTEAADAAGLASGMSEAQLQERFRRQVCATLPVFMPCANLIVDVESASTFAGIDEASPVLTVDSGGNVTNVWHYDIGNGGSVVLVRLLYLWDVPSGMLGLDFATSTQAGTLIQATVAAKAEPY